MRRAMSGVLATLLLISMSAITAVPKSHAFVIWCWDDPMIEVNGVQIQIDNGVYGDEAEVKRYVRAAETTVFVPRGSSYRLISATNRYFRETVRWVEVGDRSDTPSRQTPVRIVTRFEASKDLPAAMQVQVGGQVRATDTGSTRGRPLVAQVAISR